MQYIRLGTSGLQISRLALGCMSFGKPGTGRAWALDGDAADPIFRKAVELGITEESREALWAAAAGPASHGPAAIQQGRHVLFPDKAPASYRQR